MAQTNTRTNTYKKPDQPGELLLVQDLAANDSDKTLTVPAGKVWELESVYVELTTSADAGNRQMVLQVLDGTADVVAQANAVAVQTASGTEYYHWGAYWGTATETPATFHYIPLPIRVLPPGWAVKVLDSAAVAATADDMLVHMVVYEHVVGG